MAAMTKAMSIKLPDRLRASLIGATGPELVREAVRDKCGPVERLSRERARKAAEPQ